LDLEEALQRLFHTLPVTAATTTVTLQQALGRVLASPVSAPVDLPPFNASAMDGYAVRRDDFDTHPGQALRCLGESLAGHPFDGELTAGSCVRVFTGAKVPAGADQVLLQEEVAAIADDLVTFKPHTPAESFVRPSGHDVKAGTQLAAPGELLRGFTLGALAAAGVDRVSVYSLPRVGVFSTGDELVDPGTPPAQLRDGQIYDSNRFTVLNLLHNVPCEPIDLGRLADDPAEVRQAFSAASEQCDVLITSGGVSVGDADFVTAAIEELGQLDFWRLNLKPGKPLAFGRINKCFVFGLPGNPVSTIVTLLLLAKPAVYHLAGAQPHPPLRVTASLITPLAHSPGRTEYQRGVASYDQAGVQVRVTGDQSSNRLSTFQGANCLIEVPKQAADLQAGEQVMILPFGGLLC